MVNYYRITIPWLKVMRISTLILCMQLLVLTLLQAHESVAQTINIKATRASLRDVFNQIEKQANVTFAYKVETIQQAPPVTLVIKNQSLKETLRVLGKETKLTFEQVGNLVAVKKMQIPETPKKETPTPNLIAEPKQDNLRGRVTDSAGTPLIGVTVRINETNQTTVTNGDGYFEFTQVADDATFTFSFVGFQSKVVSIHNLKSPVVLAYYNAELTEVEVNAGYWKVNDKLRTGNISRVDGETIRQQPVIDPMLGLAGRVPGLQVTQSSGIPGAYSTVRIRGVNSISNGIDPLYLVDGIPFTSNFLTSSSFGSAAQLSPFSLINAEEIESVEILKDADATAIYGSRGANGVILISTKKGQSSQTTINFHAYSGAGKVTRMLNLLNTQQYIEMRREAFVNDGITTIPANQYDINGTWNQDRYTNWQEEILGNTARISNIQLQLSGGNRLTQFSAGGGWMKENSVLPGEYNTKKGSSNLGINHQSSDKRLIINSSLRFLMNVGDQPQSDISASAIFLPPNAPNIYNPDGTLNWENGTWVNPFANFHRRSKTDSRNLLANATIGYWLLENLQSKVSFGYSRQDMVQNIITPITAYTPALQSNSSLRTHNKSTNELKSWILESQLNYSRSLLMGLIDLTLGVTFQENNQEVVDISANDFSDDALISNIASAATIRIEKNRISLYKYAALFARVNYNWKDRYLINFVGRRDGSSRFAPGRRYGNFGAAGVAWVFTNEPFFDSNWLNYGKFRASYGITGNDQLSDYQFFNTYSSYPYSYMGISTLRPTRLHSPDFGWEAVKKLEAALDLNFFDDRFQLSTALYRNRTDNQLVGYNLPAQTGFASIQANLPAVIENKGLELEINSKNISNTKIQWSTSFNISLPRNKLVSFPDFETSVYRNTYTIGRSLSTRKLWHFNGVDPETGIVQYTDVDGDGVLTSPNDLQSHIDLAPKFFGGISNVVTYSGFNLELFFQFVKKTGATLGSVAGTMRNQDVSVLRRWREKGDVTDFPAFTRGGPAAVAILNGFSMSDRFYDDASFIRLKNVTLSYQIPISTIEKINIKSCSIYVLGQNLLTFSNYNGLDPETENVLPPIKMITAGFNITF